MKCESLEVLSADSRLSTLDYWQVNYSRAGNTEFTEIFITFFLLKVNILTFPDKAEYFHLDKVQKISNLPLQMVNSPQKGALCNYILHYTLYVDVYHWQGLPTNSKRCIQLQVAVNQEDCAEEIE